MTTGDAQAAGDVGWRPTPAGAAYLAGLRDGAAAGPAVPVAELRRLLAELDAWPPRPESFGDALDRLSDLLAEYAGEAPACWWCGAACAPPGTGYCGAPCRDQARTAAARVLGGRR